MNGVLAYCVRSTNFCCEFGLCRPVTHAWDVRLCMISFDLRTRWYHKVVDSAIDITILRNRYDHYKELIIVLLYDLHSKQDSVQSYRYAQQLTYIGEGWGKCLIYHQTNGNLTVEVHSYSWLFMSTHSISHNTQWPNNQVNLGWLGFQQWWLYHCRSQWADRSLYKTKDWKDTFSQTSVQSYSGAVTA